MHFDVRAPGLNLEVLAKAEPAAEDGAVFEAGPAAYARVVAVGADQPVVPERLASYEHLAGGFKLHRAQPAEYDAEFFGALREAAVKRRTAQADAGYWKETVGRELRSVHFSAAAAIADVMVHEADAAELGAVARGQVKVGKVNAERGQLVQRIGHQPFAAGFVDGRLHGVGHGYAGSALAQRNGCG